MFNIDLVLIGLHPARSSSAIFKMTITSLKNHTKGYIEMRTGCPNLVFV